MHKALFSVGLVGGLVLACDDPVTVDSLSTPAVFWEHQRASCSRVIAVDAEGRLWEDSGCESGGQDLDKGSPLTTQRHKVLQDLFGALPANPPPSNCDASTRTRHVFGWRKDSDRSFETWLVCVTVTSMEYSDLVGLTGEQLKIAQELEAARLER